MYLLPSFVILYGSYLPRISEVVIIERQSDRIDNAGTAIEALSCKNSIDFVLLILQFHLFLFDRHSSSLFVALIVPDIQSIHERKSSSFVLYLPLLLLFARDSFLKRSNVLS